MRLAADFRAEPIIYTSGDYLRSCAADTEWSG